MPSDDQAREVIARALIYCCDKCKEDWPNLAGDASDVLDALAAAGLHVLPPGECVIEGERWRVVDQETSTDPDALVVAMFNVALVPVEGGQ